MMHYIFSISAQMSANRGPAVPNKGTPKRNPIGQEDL